MKSKIARQRPQCVFVDGERVQAQVVYIASSPFSGSTLLCNLLGSHPEVVPAGELSLLPAIIHGTAAKNCSCGARVDQCDFWRTITQALADGIFARPTKDKSERAILDDHALFSTISAADGGARVVVDSSKSPERLQRLLIDPRLDVRVIHLVRDGRAVAMSKARSGLGTAASLRQWASKQEQIADLLATVDRRRASLVRYEDIVVDPWTEIRLLHAWMGVDSELTDILGRDRQHSCAGSGRFKVERPIQLDSGFALKYSTPKWVMSSIRNFFPLWRYQYRFSRRHYLRLASMPQRGASHDFLTRR